MQTLDLSLNACTSKQAQSDNVASVILSIEENVKEYGTPLVNLSYVAVLVAAQNVIEQVLETIKPRAYDAANHFIPEAKDGKNFTYDGNVFQLRTLIDYNYAANDTADKDFARIERRINDLDDEIKSKRELLKATKKEILRLHPNMVPFVKSSSISYKGTELELNKVE